MTSGTQAGHVVSVISLVCTGILGRGPDSRDLLVSISPLGLVLMLDHSVALWAFRRELEFDTLVAFV